MRVVMTRGKGRQALFIETISSVLQGARTRHLSQVCVLGKEKREIRDPSDTQDNPGQLERLAFTKGTPSSVVNTMRMAPRCEANTPLIRPTPDRVTHNPNYELKKKYGSECGVNHLEKSDNYSELK